MPFGGAPPSESASTSIASGPNFHAWLWRYEASSQAAEIGICATWNAIEKLVTLDSSCLDSVLPLTLPPILNAPENPPRSEEHTSELQSRLHLVCRLLLEKKKEFTIYCEMS